MEYVLGFTGDVPATDSEAHNEWHTNAGWHRTCPWDCLAFDEPYAPYPVGLFGKAPMADLRAAYRANFPRHYFGLSEVLNPAPF
jgi:hypothetical protein